MMIIITTFGCKTFPNPAISSGRETFNMLMNDHRSNATNSARPRSGRWIMATLFRRFVAIEHDCTPPNSDDSWQQDDSWRQQDVVPKTALKQPVLQCPECGQTWERPPVTGRRSIKAARTS
jgi:hypothetical protein